MYEPFSSGGFVVTDGWVGAGVSVPVDVLPVSLFSVGAGEGVCVGVSVLVFVRTQ